MHVFFSNTQADMNWMLLNLSGDREIQNKSDAT